MTEAIYAEWKQHQGRWSRAWLAKMTSSKRVAHQTVGEDAGLRQAIARALTSDADRVAVDKDAHLVEAALAADRIVASCDENARRPFRIAAVKVRRLRSLIWVNPTYPAEDCAEWLRRGAPAQAERKLGYTTRNDMADGQKG
jgi:hypothetical protein